MTSEITIFTITGSCSDAVVALCSHLGLAANFLERKFHETTLIAVNSQRTVPTLLDANQLVLTETSAILNHIARNYAVELLGRGAEERARNEEMLSFLSTTVYNAFLLHFRPDRSADGDDARAAIRSKAPQAIMAALSLLSIRLQARNFAAGSHLTTSDFMLLVMLNWAEAVDPQLLSQLPILKVHHDKLRSMPFYQRELVSNKT